MTPNEIEKELVEVQLELASKRKMLKHYEKSSLTFKTRFAQLVMGEAESQKRIDSLNSSDVVLLSEYSIVQQLHKSFTHQIEKTKMELAECKAAEANLTGELKDLTAREAILLALSSNNNVLEFPYEPRFSEEED